jgi:transcriptional regulator with XRE-family HTH domain
MQNAIICPMTNFNDWLGIELERRNLKPIELARLAHVDPGAISRILNGDRKPSPETLEAFAHALKLPPEEVYRAAGLLPPDVDESLLDKRIRHLVETLPTDEDKEEVLAYVELRHKLAEERGRYEAKPKAKPAKP